MERYAMSNGKLVTMLRKIVGSSIPRLDCLILPEYPII